MIEIDRCPLGYFCETMVGVSVFECPNLDTCFSLRPYCGLEFPTYENQSNQVWGDRATENLSQQWGEVDLPNPYSWDVEDYPQDVAPASERH